VKVSTNTLTQTVAVKKGKSTHKSHKMHKMGKRAKSKGPGRCGTMMYWSRKGHHCMDASKK
jgi:hypothetical protein